MKETAAIVRYLYKHSFIRYVAVGGSTFAIDFLLLISLHSGLGFNVLLAATISYWTSIAFNFIVNRHWTFDATETHIAKHAAAYGVLLAFNYIFTIVFIGSATHLGIHYTIAKIFAVAIQISWTYIAYKKFIFK